MTRQIECLAKACIMQTKKVMTLEAKIAELERVNWKLIKRLHNSYAKKLACIVREQCDES